MEKLTKKIESSNINREIKHIDSEDLKKITEEYEKDPDNFYELNKFELWEGGKNPALIISVELAAKFIRDIWKEKNLGDPEEVAKEAKNIAMFVMKYLGADIEGFCKVSPETAIEVDKKMGEEYDFKKNCQLILEDIKKNDPVFSQFLAKVCAKDLKTGEIRNENEIVAIVEMVGVIVRTIYEQMKKDKGIN
jgi:hypothetical protein